MKGVLVLVMFFGSSIFAGETVGNSGDNLIGKVWDMVGFADEQLREMKANGSFSSKYYRIYSNQIAPESKAFKIDFSTRPLNTLGKVIKGDGSDFEYLWLIDRDKLEDELDGDDKDWLIRWVVHEVLETAGEDINSEITRGLRFSFRDFEAWLDRPQALISATYLNGSKPNYNEILKLSVNCSEPFSECYIDDFQKRHEAPDFTRSRGVFIEYQRTEKPVSKYWKIAGSGQKQSIFPGCSWDYQVKMIPLPDGFWLREVRNRDEKCRDIDVHRYKEPIRIEPMKYHLVYDALAKRNRQDKNLYHAFSSAAKGEVEKVKAYVTVHGADNLDWESKNLLMAAISGGQLEMVDFLIEFSNLAHRNDRDMDAMDEAVRYPNQVEDSVAIIERLLATGGGSAWAGKAFLYFVSNGILERALKLLDSPLEDESLEQATKELISTIFPHADHSNYLDLMIALTRPGFPEDIKVSALNRLIRLGEFELAKQALESGVDPNGVDFNGVFPLFAAVNYELRPEIAHYLLDNYDIDKNMRVESGTGPTALHGLVGNYDEALIFKVATSENVNIKPDLTGVTVMHMLASKMALTEEYTAHVMARLQKEYGADYNVISAEQNTTLDIVVEGIFWLRNRYKSSDKENFQKWVPYLCRTYHYMKNQGAILNSMKTVPPDTECRYFHG